MTDTLTQVVHEESETARERLRRLLTDYRTVRVIRDESQMMTEEQWMRTFLKPVPR